MRKEKAIKIALFVGILMASAAAFWFGLHFVNQTDDRQPAAIPSSLDFNDIEGTALKRATQEKLIDGAKVVVAGTTVGLELGNFAVRGPNDSTTDACAIYDKVELT